MFKSRVDENAATELLKDLVKIDSVNPTLVPGAKGESEIAEYIADWLKVLGLKVKVDKIEAKRCNAVGVLKGAGGGKSLMLNGHTDTVGYDYMTIDPLKPVVKEGRMYGRGTYDMKGGLVASLAALKAVIDSGTQLKGDVVVAAVCDEEYASIGTERVMEKTRVDAAIVGEPSALQIKRCHKGFAWIDVETKGLAAHGSMWQVGVDAIEKMGKVLTGLEDIGTKLQLKKHPLVGPASVHAGIIKGGLELSTYPDKCLLQIERRLIPGEERRDVEEEMETLLRGIADKDPQFTASYEIIFYRDSMDVPETSEICQTIVNCSKEAIKLTPAFIGGSGWLDTQIIWGKGIPAVAYGPAGGGDHAAIEWVDLETVMDAARVQELVIRRFCGEK
ncbi:MAG: ArgE/DapE family deacylase [Candidatus Bathyarchaeota archaeon]|nr:ArgE/DapE family deacylase [Candidatus Bathyarchaeota archaeon]